MKLSLKKTPMINGEHEEHRSPPLSELQLTWGNLPRYPLLALIRFYQLTLSRTLPKDTCRFYPTCSHYGYQAIFKYGVFKGGWMAVTRIVRCNPFNEGGIDPVK